VGKRIWFCGSARQTNVSYLQKTIAVLKRANLQRHHEQLHPEFKAAYPPDSDLRRTKLQTLLDGFQAQ